MTSFPIIKDFDVIKKAAERLVSVPAPVMVHPFCFKPPKEALGNGIIVAVAFAAHAADEAMGFKNLLVIA